MFILDRPASDKPTLIFLKKKLYDGDFKESLGVKVLPALWIKSSERAAITGLDRATAQENKSINALLQKIESFIEVRTQEARHSGNHLTCIELSEKLQEWTGNKRRKKEKAGTGFYDRCDLIVADMRAGLILTAQGKRYSAATLKCYELYLRNLKDYNPALSFKIINLEFYRSFIKWCNDKDWSLNYIGQHLNKLIVLMKEARKRGWHNNTAYQDGEFKRLREETEDITLSLEELDKLYLKNIPDRTRDIARDWFIIACYTGLRVSDILLLSDLNIKSDTITIANEKTDIKVVIPIRPEIRAILKKWSGLPPKLTDMEISRSIKEVAEVCGLTDTVLYFLTKGGKRQDFYLKKYEMISPHTARRCFITNLLNAGVPDNQVMQLAGIKKHATLLRYKKTKPEETADILQEHAFFKGASKPAAKEPAGKQ